MNADDAVLIVFRVLDGLALYLRFSRQIHGPQRSFFPFLRVSVPP
jgi:hypothetical protein